VAKRSEPKHKKPKPANGLKYEKEHLLDAGMSCPECRWNGSLAFGDIEPREDGEITQDCRCGRCGCCWRDVFILTSVHKLNG